MAVREKRPKRETYPEQGAWLNGGLNEPAIRGTWAQKGN